MKTRIATLPAILLTLIMSLLVATSAFALPITPVSYDMKNGGSGSYQYWDDSYNGVGSKTTNYAQLSGGSGDLTDGIIATTSWNIAEPPAGAGPYVGWNSFNPTITFRFDSYVNIDSLTLFLDDPNGSGGVSLPASVTLAMGGSSINYDVVDPVTATPFPVTVSDLGFYGDILTLTINRKGTWVFLSEVTFDDGLTASVLSTSAPVPEPGTLVLLGAGLFGLVVFSKRRMSRS